MDINPDNPIVAVNFAALAIQLQRRVRLLRVAVGADCPIYVNQDIDSVQIVKAERYTPEYAIAEARLILRGYAMVLGI